MRVCRLRLRVRRGVQAALVVLQDLLFFLVFGRLVPVVLLRRVLARRLCLFAGDEERDFRVLLGVLRLISSW